MVKPAAHPVAGSVRLNWRPPVRWTPPTQRVRVRAWRETVVRGGRGRGEREPRAGSARAHNQARGPARGIGGQSGPREPVAAASAQLPPQHLTPDAASEPRRNPLSTKGEVVYLAFALDCCGREVIAFVATPYATLEKVIEVERLKLVPINAPAPSPESNGMSKAFVNTLRRNYVDGAELGCARAVIEAIPGRIEDYKPLPPTRRWG
jgi:hypothetical protein